MRNEAIRQENEEKNGDERDKEMEMFHMKCLKALGVIWKHGEDG